MNPQIAFMDNIMSKTDYKWESARENFNKLRQKLIDSGLMKPRAKDLAEPSNQDRNDIADPSEQRRKDKEHEEAIPEEAAQDSEDKELEVFSQAPELARRDIKGKEKVVIELDNENDDDGYSSFPSTVPIKKRKRSITAIVDAPETSNPTAVPSAERGRRKTTARKATRPRPRMSSSSSDFEETDSDEDYTIGSESRRRINRVVKIKEQEKMLHGRWVGMNQMRKPVGNTVEGSEKRRRGRPRKEEKLVCTSDLPDKIPNSHDPAEERVLPEDPNVSDPTEKTILLEDLNIPTHIVIDPETVYQRTRPVWFQLVASDTQDSCDALPSLQPRYIHAKDDMPASCIKKYLALKLGLGSEDELEIRMRGALVHPDTQMHQLVELWVQTATELESQERGAVGSSGEDFVMIFVYGWSNGGADQL